MPEVYTLRAPENFNYTNGRHLSSSSKLRSNRKPAVSSSKSNNFLQPPSSTIHRTTTVPTKTKRKSPISYQSLHRQKSETFDLNTRDRKTPEYNRQSPSPNIIHQKPKSNTPRTRSNTPSPNEVTTYTIKSPNDNHYPPYISRTPSPPIQRHRKNQLVTFDPIYHHDKYDTFTEQQQQPSSIGISYVPSFRSKAMESINRSMNLYRFQRY